MCRRSANVALGPSKRKVFVDRKAPSIESQFLHSFQTRRSLVSESTNYGLLMTIFGQIPAGNSRIMFIRALLNLTVEKAVHKLSKYEARFPAWENYASALPLVAEFAIRNGHLYLVIESLNKARLPNPSIAGMFRQLEETVAVDFDVFAEGELEVMPAALSQIREIADRQTWTSRGARGDPVTTNNPHYRQRFSLVGKEVVESIDGLSKHCEHARYFYLKRALQQTRSPEVEGDKKAVQDYLATLGFNELMVKALNAAEQDMRSTATAFELKNALGHLRSFPEELHIQIQGCTKIVPPGETAPDKWGAATLFLRNKNVVTLKEEQFINDPIYACQR